MVKDQVKEARIEDPSAMGRADITLCVRDGLYYVIELKLDKSASEAITQIKEKMYAERFLMPGNRVHLLGINFSSAERNISDRKEEIIEC